MRIIAHTAPPGIARPDHEEDGYGLLTYGEMVRLIDRFLTTRATDGATEEEILAVCKWGHEAKVSATLLELVLKGEVLIDLENGVPIMARPGTERKR